MWQKYLSKYRHPLLQDLSKQNAVSSSCDLSASFLSVLHYTHTDMEKQHHLKLISILYVWLGGWVAIGHLYGTIVGPTGRSDRSVGQVGPTIVSCKRFVRPVGRIKHVWFRPTADPTVEACGHYVRLVGPTGQSDDQSRCSVGGTCCLRYSYIAAAVIITRVVDNQLAGHIDLIDRCGRFGYSLSDRSVRLVSPTSRT